MEVITFLLVLVTVGYTFGTFMILKQNKALVKEMRNQNDALNRPYVYIRSFTVPLNFIAYLMIENKGKTSADNLRLTIDRDFYAVGSTDERKNLRNYNAFKKVIECFPPNSEMIFTLAAGHTVIGDKADPKLRPPVFNIRATYEYSGGKKKISENTTIDLRRHLSVSSGLDPVAEQLSKIREEFEKIRRSYENDLFRRNTEPILEAIQEGEKEKERDEST